MECRRSYRKPIALLLGAALSLVLCCALSLGAQEVYDIVILNGRVMDPETQRDQIANVGIRDEKIAVITPLSIRCDKEIDATGLVIAPGFIDILSSTNPDREPALRSQGMDYVVVNGRIVCEGGPIVEGAAPGQWLRHSCAEHPL
jgi:hypothetical protein